MVDSPHCTNSLYFMDYFSCRRRGPEVEAYPPRFMSPGPWFNTIGIYDPYHTVAHPLMTPVLPVTTVPTWTR